MALSKSKVRSSSKNSPQKRDSHSRTHYLVEKSQAIEKKLKEAIKQKNAENQLKIETDIFWISAGIVLFLWIGHLSKPNSIFSNFLKLQYKIDASGTYGIGYKDFYYFLQITTHLLFFRSFLSLFIGRRFARFMGVKNVASHARISEQIWGISVASTSFCFGAYLIYSNPQYFRLDTAWSSYPLIKLPYKLKFYYLFQTSFWTSAFIYLFIEKRRSDFLAMFAHHTITISMLLGSYYTNFTAMGTIIHTSMDFADIFVPLAKLFKYLDYQLACTITFAFMAFSWIATRHVFLLRLIYNVAFEANTYIDYAWDPKAGKYASIWMQRLFVFLLICLQLLCCIWLYAMIVLIINTISGKELDDIRSDDEN
ncbi:hypothetical protein BB559_004397 [Furculomyces boomerangus]|uniref:TLC domain-containing protein n=1 Tax=Furculomyces boomerangus TaxID=61424 RepID=A0A2T9YEX3_9FUNG|nr:hypothetical protein BB559_004397 [Furculomyces boomerangus]